MNPLEKQRARVLHIIDALRMTGDDTAIQLRAEVGSIRFQRSWRIGPTELAAFRAYTLEQLAGMDDSSLGARLRSDADAMDRILVARATADVVARARELGMTYGAVLEQVRV